MSQANEINSRNIPLPIQREIRQRCGFGCVICGMPLYEYEHMLGWADVKRHVAEEITLLCDSHHREKTNGLLPVEQVRVADQDPYNKREGVSKPYALHYSGSTCEAIIGGNSFTTEDVGYGTLVIPLVVDRIPLVGFVLTDGHLLLNITAFDESNRLVMRIVNNQLVYSVTSWDIQLTGRNLTLRSAHRDILLDIEFAVPNKIIINRGHFLCNGIDVVLNPSYALVVNNQTLLSKNQVKNCRSGIVIGEDMGGGAMIVVSDVPRYSEQQRKEAIKWANQRLKEHQ